MGAPKVFFDFPFDLCSKWTNCINLHFYSRYVHSETQQNIDWRKQNLLQVGAKFLLEHQKLAIVISDVCHS